ncbi:MAG: putative glycoside hydrolase [Candidatus Geothermincolia bacterium]
MARKRTFSNSRRSDAGRSRLTYGELEQRRRSVERETEPRTSEGRRRQTRQSVRGPVDMPPTRKTTTKARTGSPRGKRKGLTGVHVAIGVVCILAVVIPIWLFVFVLPSPIGGLTPANGSSVNTRKVVVKATISSSFKPEDVRLKVDGKDATANIKVDKKVISTEVDLPDGRHTALLQVKTGGLVSNHAANWSFKVDSTPPVVKITQSKVTATKKPSEVQVVYAGTVEGGATVKVDGKPIAVDKKGQFKGTATASRAKSFKVTATDASGNEANAYVVTQKATAAKGAHVSVFIAASETDLAKMIGLVERTELNALQVDLKDEAGQIAYASDYPLAVQAKAVNNWIKLDSCVDQMRYKGIYSICRVVCFKDPKLGKLRPDLAVQDKAGGVWGKGVWLDPYSKEVWDYDLAVAEAAAKAGFNEIQFDYVRFPSDGNTTTCAYPHQDSRTPVQVIDSFLTYARERLAAYNVFISADLFGLTASKQGEMGIGQSVKNVAERVDYISPMVYPSHYNLGEYDIKVPEANPGDTVTRSLEDFKKVIPDKPSKLRPWLQDFTLKITYTPDMVRRQIDACEKLGINQWLLWDPDCSYSEAALKKK